MKMKHALITLFVLTALSMWTAAFAETPQEHAHEKRLSQMEHPKDKTLEDLKPGEKCYTYPYAFSSANPCSKKNVGTVNTVAENIKGVLYIDGKTLEENRKANKSN